MTLGLKSHGQYGVPNEINDDDDDESVPPHQLTSSRKSTSNRVNQSMITSEREARSEFFCGLGPRGEIWVCAARPDPTRHDPVTLLRSLYLWNGLTVSRSVFFVRCHHSINLIFDWHQYPPVLAPARGKTRQNKQYNVPVPYVTRSTQC